MQQRDPMDEGDIAADYQGRLNADGIEAARANLPDPAAESAELCEWCGDPIPEGRRRAQKGCRLCVNCQPQKDRLASPAHPCARGISPSLDVTERGA